ncbi:MAG: hypothetical protein ACRDSL_12990 [Pseudonocardiaceae bacterium]
MLAQALLYADKVLLITAAEDDYDWMENEDAFDFIELFGDSIQVLEAGMFDFDSSPVVVKAIAGLCALEAAAHLRDNQEAHALRKLRLAFVAFDAIGSNLSALIDFIQ